MTTFEEALAFVLEREGKYSNDSDDPGGETIYGISKRSHPDFDGKFESAKQIYRMEYWDALGCDEMPGHFAVVAFDTAVNCGVKRTAAWINSGDGTIASLLAFRVRHYANLCIVNPRLCKWLRGWLSRVNGVWELALKIKERNKYN